LFLVFLLLDCVEDEHGHSDLPERGTNDGAEVTLLRRFIAVWIASVADGLLVVIIVIVVVVVVIVGVLFSIDLFIINIDFFVHRLRLFWLVLNDYDDGLLDDRDRSRRFS